MVVRSPTMEEFIDARLTMEGSEGGGGLNTRDRHYQKWVSHTQKGMDVDRGPIPSSVRGATSTSSGLSKKGEIYASVEVAGTVDALKSVTTADAILDATDPVASVAFTEVGSGGSLFLDGSRDKVGSVRASKDVVTDAAAAGSGVEVVGYIANPNFDSGIVIEGSITSGRQNADKSDTGLEAESHRISSNIDVGADAVNVDRRGSFTRYQPKRKGGLPSFPQTGETDPGTASSGAITGGSNQVVDASAGANNAT